MADKQASSSQSSKFVWTPEENYNLLLTIWRQQDPAMTIKGWDKITEELQKVHPNKGVGAFKHQLKKLRDPFLAANGGLAPKATAEQGAKADGRPKASRKRAVPTADVDNTHDGDVPRKPRVAKKAKTGTATAGEARSFMIDDFEELD